MAEVLIVDDDFLVVEMLRAEVVRLGHNVFSAYSLYEARAKNRECHYDIIFLDVQMPDGNGLDFIPEFRESPSEPEVIIMTGQADADGATIAIKSGAWSYLDKSSVVDGMDLPLSRALQFREEKSRNQFKSIELKKSKIISSSPEIKKSLELVKVAATSDVSVLLTGETGTGKELFARAIHENGNRAVKNFVVVDCASLPETMVESILLGHEKGAFTGAAVASRGLVKQADCGTLFLDEVGELPLDVQKAFLRVLQEQRYRPLGASYEIESDFRLIAATNRDLNDMVAAGAFRQDLLFRLKGFEIDLPPLSKRKSDILELAGYHIDCLCARYGQERKVFSLELKEALLGYEWPGNVRELIQAMERVFVVAMHSKTLFECHLPESIRITHSHKQLRATASPKAVSSTLIPTDAMAGQELPPWKTLKDQCEADYFRNLISRTAGNISAASKISGVSRPSLYQIFKKHGLSPNRIL